MREILAPHEETHERPSLTRDRITDRTAQRRKCRFESVEDRRGADGSCDVDFHFASHARQSLEMRRQKNPDHRVAHAKVCTSTDKTAGRSRTMASQESPSSDET